MNTTNGSQVGIEVWTAEDTAIFLRCTRRKVLELARTGALPCKYVGRDPRFVANKVREWLER